MSTSVLQDTLPAKMCGWNNEGGVFIYKLTVDSTSALTIRDVTPQAGYRQVICGWSHSASFDHNITFDLGNGWTPVDRVLSNTRYGIPIAAHIMWPGYPDHKITITPDVATSPWTGFCAIAEVSQLYFG